MGGKTTRTSDTKILEFKVNSATYGLPVPVVLGTARISGNVIDWFDFTAIPHTETTRTGKGGGSKTEHTTYTYTAAVLLGLAEGPIGGVDRVWADDAIYNSLSSLGLTLFNGAFGQAPWSYTQSKQPAKALPYSGLAYAAGVVDLNSSGGLPQLNFEVRGMLRETGDGTDVNPADAIQYICTDPVNGVGFGVGGIDTDSLERYRTYCKAADLLITVEATETKKAYEIINEICQATNTIVFWSQNKLKLVPRCDERLERNGVVYEPDNTPLYELDERDFLDTGEAALVKFEREDNAEAYNHVPVEFINRANGYEKETADGEILSDINRRGRRSKSTVNLPYLRTKARAQYVANLLVAASLYGRNRYTFKLGWAHCLLEPGDFVTIYDPIISPNPIPVLIDEIEESEDGDLDVIAIGRKPGANSGARYATHEAERPSIDYNAPPGDTVATIFDLSPEIAEGLAACIAVSGGDTWGGCSVWVSDTGEAYQQIGSIDGPSRHGVLTADLPAGAAIDTVNVLQVQMYSGQLLSGTEADAQNLNTLCWVDGELIAYATATLTGDRQYTLSYLVRGVYNTPIKCHPAGSKFVRLDRGIFRYPFDADRLNKQIYIKLTSYNIHGSATQSLAEVTPITHTLTAQLPPNVSDIVVDEDTYRLRDGTVLSDIIVSFNAPRYLALSHYNIFYDLNDTGRTYAGMTDKNTYVIKALPQAKTIRVKVTTVGAGLESEGTISAPYTIIGKSAAPPDVTWGECSFIDRIILRWNAVSGSDIDKYEVRLDTNFGADDANLIYRGDGLFCVFDKPTQREYRFWIKALDRSGNYSVNATDITLENPVPSTPSQPIITLFFSALWVEIQPVPDNDIVGYALYMTPCDEQGNPTGDAQKTIYPTAQRVTWQATPKSSFLVQVAAFDILGEGEKSTPVLARTRTIDEVAAFAQNIVFPRIVDELPELPHPDYPIDSLVVLKTDHKLYRNVGVVWDNSVSTEQLVGKITAGMIAAGAIGAAEIAAQSLVANHFAAGSIEAYVAAVQEAFIDSAKIISIEADKIKVGGSSAPIPLAIQPTDTLFRFDGSLLSTQGLKPLGME